MPKQSNNATPCTLLIERAPKVYGGGKWIGALRCGRKTIPVAGLYGSPIGVVIQVSAQIRGSDLCIKAVRLNNKPDKMLTDAAREAQIGT
jgi:hypothetical protein